MTALSPDYSNYFFQGDITRLRQWRMDDAEMRHISDFDSESVALFQDGIEVPRTLDQHQDWLEKVISGENDSMIRFVIENMEGVPVGWINLHSRDQKNGTFGFGVCVYRPYRGNGYAVDAARIILKFGFWEQRYQKCNSMCLDNNAASIRLHEKLGFVSEGRIRRTCFYNGGYLDDVLFGMTREEFDDIMKQK